MRGQVWALYLQSAGRRGRGGGSLPSREHGGRGGNRDTTPYMYPARTQHHTRARRCDRGGGGGSGDNEYKDITLGYWDILGAKGCTGEWQGGEEGWETMNTEMPLLGDIWEVLESQYGMKEGNRDCQPVDMM